MLNTWDSEGTIRIGYDNQILYLPIAQTTELILNYGPCEIEFSDRSGNTIQLFVGAFEDESSYITLSHSDRTNIAMDKNIKASYVVKFVYIVLAVICICGLLALSIFIFRRVRK